MGVASSGERTQVETWVRQYPEVAAELATIEKSLEDLAFANAVKPADDIKSQISAKLNFNNSANVTAETTAPKAAAQVVSISPLWKRAAAAAIILFIVSAILNFVYYKKFNDAQLAYQQKNEALIAQTQKLDSMSEDMSIVQNKYSLPVALNGLPAAPNAAAKIFWMKNTGEVYVDPSNLPEAPQGMQYQLWGIVDGKPVDGGMIENNKGSRYHIQKMKVFGKAEAFAITLETKGGNPTPKGDMYVLGKL